MKERTSDQWVSIGLSVLLHGSVVALLVYGWWSFHTRSQPPLPMLAINATVVDGRALSAPKAPAAQPPPQPAPPTPPPTPPPDAAEKAQAEAEQHKIEEDKRVAEQKQLEEKQAADARAEAERKAKEEAARKAQEEAERKKAQEAEARKREEQRVAEAKRAAEEKRKAEEARQNAENEADLRKSLAEEERLMSARSGPAMASWQQQIRAKIERAWIRPPSARAGIECTLFVTQVPGGEIVNVKVGDCNGDQAVRQSIEAAAYRASPLPAPPDPALFDRNLVLTFKPSD
jgi:colicin import membrane protein